jgi:uracil-DNA glycosylase
MSLPMGSGSPSAPIMIVGEARGENEERLGQPFVGASGMELNKMLNEAGIMASECWKTNVINARPPRNDLEAWIPVTKKGITSDMVQLRGRWVKPIVREGYESLLKEISLVKPRLIVALGNTALWALTGRNGIIRWRGSLLDFNGIRVVPTYHPAAVLRMWEWRVVAVHDLARARREFLSPTPQPEYKFLIKPTFDTVLTTLGRLWNRALLFDEDVWLDFDIETVAGHIRCFALSWSATEAIAIPLMTTEDWSGYWSVEEEGTILWHTYKLLTHPKVKVRGQNLLYDFQYTYKHWHFVPTLGQDTMLSQHTMFPGLPKSLLFQASMYCEYFWNWKDLVKHNAEEKEGA